MLCFTSGDNLNKLIHTYSGLPGWPSYITEVPMIAAAGVSVAASEDHPCLSFHVVFLKLGPQDPSRNC